MGASVKIMLSYDYCHFEISKSTDQEITDKSINEMRKDVQRLADEAVRQYKIAKQKAAQRSNISWAKKEFVNEVNHIYQNVPEPDRTPEQLAKIKLYEDENWQEQFDYPYDYEDDVELL